MIKTNAKKNAQIFRWSVKTKVLKWKMKHKYVWINQRRRRNAILQRKNPKNKLTPNLQSSKKLYLSQLMV